jgi:tRNA pseudouridine13 synthase
MTEIDITIGIEEYITSTKGIKGKLRNTFEDFQVEEIPLLKLHTDGKYLIIKATKKNWDTFNFVRVLSNKLGIGQKRIGFAGNKDKRSLSTQFFSIWNVEEERIEAIRIPDVKIEVIGRSDQAMKLGNLKGNRFRITVSEIESCSPIKETAMELKEKGIPNFFGHQRFGAQRAITHVVGKLILKKDYENAFWHYTGKPFPYEPEETRKLREELWNTRDPSLIKDLPNYLRYEKILLQEYIQHKDYRKALLKLPKNLRIMFIHAYQSFLFNRLLSARIREFRNLYTIDAGDVVCLTEDGLPNERKVVTITSNYKKTALKLIEAEKITLSLPLPGYETSLSDGWIAERLMEILEEEEVDLAEFRHEIPEFSSKGSWRPATINYSHTSFTWVCDMPSATFEFFLPKGSYATSLMREFTKTSPLVL